MPSLYAKEQLIETDPEGYLKDLSQWNEAIAEAIARLEGIALTAEHWQVIYFLREFYQQYQIAPAMRVLVKALAVRGEMKKAIVFIFTAFFHREQLSSPTKLLDCPSLRAVFSRFEDKRSNHLHKQVYRDH